MRKLILTNLHKAMPYLGDNLDSSRSFLNSSLANNNLFFFSLYSSLILVLTNCSNILPRKGNKTQRLLRKPVRYLCLIKGLSISRPTALICPPCGPTRVQRDRLHAALLVFPQNKQLEKGVIWTDNISIQTSRAT